MIIQIEPWIDEVESSALEKVISNGFVTENKFTKSFEINFRNYTETNRAVAYTNGTMALYACLKAVGVSHGDEVIVPNLTFVATANAVHMLGATPVFVDIEYDTFGIDPCLIPSAITNKTKCIVPVHLYGRPCQINSVVSIAKEYNLMVVEDAAQGVGVRHNGKHMGTFGDMGVLSFYGNKTMTCGEGGLVLTNDDTLADYCYMLKNHGRMTKGTFIHDEIGYNFAFTEMQAAIGLAQFFKLPDIIKKKKKIFDFYKSELSKMNCFELVEGAENDEPVYWFTSLLVDDATHLQNYLLDNQIQSRRFFYPLSEQPCYKNHQAISQRNICDYPVSKDVYNRGLSLPSSYGLKTEEQEKVIKALLQYGSV